MKHKKSALFKSVISLILCLSMLIGATFAWFTDSVVTGINTIAAGNLDVELFHSNAAVSNERVDSNTKLFMDLQGDPILWEPGVVSYENLRVTNAGDLALVYQLAINTANENYVVDASGARYGLSQALKLGVVEGGITATDRAAVVASVEYTSWTTLADFIREGKLLPEGAGVFEETWGIVIWWEPGENDNLWNLNNGKQLNEGDVLSIDLGVKLIATQAEDESDAFGTDYDETAKKDVFPEFEGGSASVTVVPNDQNQTASEVVMVSGGVKAVVPAGVQLAENTTVLTMTVTEMDATGSNITLGKDEAMRSLDVHIEGISPDNTVPITVTLEEVAPVGLNMGNYKLYHVENGATVEMTLMDSTADFTSHNQFKYDPATGDIVLYMATFSEVAVVADTVNAWNGTVAENFNGGTGTKTDPYIIASADQLAYMGDRVSNDNANYRSAHYKLIVNINFGGDENYNTNGRKVLFYPIGYNKVGGTTANKGNWYTYGGAFSGTFDGTGHAITGIYQNTWAMVGDYSGTYYNDAMGLFGYVSGGTVKNLTIDNFYSEGEFAPTGCVAAYAAGKCTFENIAITNSHPQTYNTGVAGIVGWDNGGDTEADASNFTFKNITVDSSNTISALWGSWDVAAAGLLGYLGEYSKANLVNCNVSATIDVYNDVCGNYQYYWYRYCGMLIGTVDKTKGDGSLDLSNITAENCTVDFGDRHEYYYCEFVKNSIASYTHDYQFSRVDNKDIVGQGDSATCQNHNHDAQGTEIINGQNVLVEDKQAVYIPFRQLFGGYGWGVKGTELGENLADNIKDITKKNEPNANDQVKFACAFPDSTVNEDGIVQTKFLYRVGNANNISVGSLFAAKDGASINSSGVVVSIDNYEKGADVSGVFTPNTSNWTNGTIKFSGTGLAKITIQDYDYCTPTELIVEVVDAYNATTALPAPYTYNGVKYSVVLLNDVINGSFTVGAGYGFYGNGFTITLNPASHSTTRGAGFDGYIHMNGGTLDNVRIEGPVFAASNIYRAQGETGSESNDPVNYFRNAVIVDSGDAKITNSYLSGGRTALYVKNGGDVKIENTTISGGAYANIEVSVAKSITLRNVTTVQKATKDSYGQNKDMIGIAIVIDNAETKLILDGLTQDNWMTQVQWDGMLGSYKSQFPELFTDTAYTDLWHKNTAGTKVVNTGIIYACDVTELNMVGTIPGYDKTKITLVSTNGYVYTLENGGNTDKVVDGINDPDYGSNDQAAIPPVATFDYFTKNYQQYVDGENEYCYYDAGVVKIGFTKGQSKVWDPMILSIKKGDKTINDYKVTMNGTDFTNKSLTFTEAGNYQVVYTYTDPYNYKYSDDKLVSYSVDYEEVVNITVNVTEETAKNAEFTMGNNNNPVEKIQIGDNTYLSACGLDNSSWTSGTGLKFPKADSDTSTISFKYNGKTNGSWASATIDGQTFYFPVVAMGTTDSKWAHTGSWYGCFPVFDGAITIKDYKDGGTGSEVTYSSSTTTTMPANLSALYPQTVFRYQGTQSKVPTTPSKMTAGTYNGKLCYTTQTDLSASNERGEEWDLATYKYTDNKGATYYWYVAYYCAASTNGGCVTPDTLVTLADGTQKRVDALTGEEKLLVWNHTTGAFESAPVAYIVDHNGVESETEIIHLYFDNGYEIKIIGEHVFFDSSLYKYVALDINAENYIGHEFAVKTGNALTTAKLTKVERYTEVTTIYEVVSYEHITCFTNNILSASAYMDQLLNIFDINPETMAYNAKDVQKDIETYGLYTYADFEGLIEEEAFELYNAKYLKIAVGKGYITWDDILALIDIYFNVKVEPIQ